MNSSRRLAFLAVARSREAFDIVMVWSSRTWLIISASPSQRDVAVHRALADVQEVGDASAGASRPCGAAIVASMRPSAGSGSRSTLPETLAVTKVSSSVSRPRTFAGTSMSAEKPATPSAISSRRLKNRRWPSPTSIGPVGASLKQERRVNAALHLDRLHEALQGVFGVRVVFAAAVGIFLRLGEDLREHDLLDAHAWAFQLETFRRLLLLSGGLRLPCSRLGRTLCLGLCRQASVWGFVAMCKSPSIIGIV